MWRCPHCGTPQAETTRCWVCHRSSTACATCRHFRRSVAAQLGYCGLDRQRHPLRGDEIRGCWEAALTPVETTATPVRRTPPAAPEVVLDRTPVRRLEFVEVLSVTQLHAGIADNVIPGEATATLSFRYPPDRDPAEAEAYLCALVPDGAALEIVGNSAPGRVVADSTAVRALQAAGDLAINPKQAWTNVADFTSRGIDAGNFGPGGTRWAHARDEQVEVEALVRVFRTLWLFLTMSP